MKQGFEKHYRALNQAQREAVDAIEGPVMVIAGPGTGKTQILSLRIANILKKTDTHPSSILALTFTESGVYSMRKRLVEIMGSTAYKVNIFTFHGFANELIKNYPEEFSRIVGSRNITEVDQIEMIENIISKGDFKKLKLFGNNYFYVRSILKNIQSLKRENISTKDLSEWLDKKNNEFRDSDDIYHKKGPHKGKMKGKYRELEKKMEKNREFLTVYEKYEKNLRKQNLYDYEDMIMEAVRVLSENQGLLLTLQENYQYILADEHQDANNAQNKILELLSSFHSEPNLFIVGDAKQAIFRFQGASLDNFLYFKGLFPSAIVIDLEENYRSPQYILDAASSIIEKSQTSKISIARLSSKMKTDKKFLEMHEFSNTEFEHIFIAQDIKKRLSEGVDPNEIAVIFRNNKHAIPIAKAMDKVGIPYIIESSQDILSSDEVLNFILLLRAVDQFGYDESLGRILYLDFLDLDHLDLYKLFNFARMYRKSLYECISNIEILESIGMNNPEPFYDLYLKMSSWSRIAKNRNILETFEIVSKESNFLKSILTSKISVDRLKKIDDLFEEVRQSAEGRRSFRLSDFCNYLDTLEKYELLIKTKDVSRSHIAGVRLMTAHRSKGREFEYVYISGASDRHWKAKVVSDHFQLPINPDVLNERAESDDERRLFYVALTRAKKEVIISFSNKGPNGEIQLPTQFIEEIRSDLLEKKDLSLFEKETDSMGLKFAPSKRPSLDISNKKYLNNLFIEQGLSPTALNNYLNCPWSYFFKNLIRLPTSLSKHQIYGNACHFSMKYFFDKYAKGEKVSKTDMLKGFKTSLSKYSLTEAELIEFLDRGEQSLGGYYDFYKGSWHRSVLNEFKISGIFLSLSKKSIFPEILIRGVLDKIEIYDNFRQVNVVDYKTAKPKSRNDIEGKTKNSNGDYKRQLVFYKVLIDRFEGEKYEMVSGEIDFLEPDPRGRFRKEQFDISKEDAEELVVVIKDVANEILELSFWDKECEDLKCQYCRLGQIIRSKE